MVAFTSYLFTWKADQSLVQDGFLSLMADDSEMIQNKLGKLGAWFSHLLFFYGFGPASYVFVMLSFVFGVNLAFGKKIFRNRSLVRYSFLTLVWVSVTFAYIFQWSDFHFGGAFGLAITNWLIDFMGQVGTGAFLFFSTAALSVILFNLELKLPAFKKKAGGSSEFSEVTIDENGSIELTMEPDDTEVKEWEQQIVEENQSVEMNVEVPKVEQPDVPEELSLEIESNGNGNGHSKDEEFRVETVESDMELQVEDVIEEKLADADQFEPYDPKLDLPNFKVPPIDFLEPYGSDEIKIDQEELENNKNRIIQTLNNYKIEISKIKATIGPTVTLYEIVPAAGIKISKIKNLEDDIALSLAALGIRIIAPIPGKGTIGIEVPNVKKEVVSMRSMIASEKFQTSEYELPVALGKSIANEIFIADLAKMPHLLMAGATGQGKSVGLNALLVSLLYKKIRKL